MMMETLLGRTSLPIIQLCNISMKHLNNNLMGVVPVLQGDDIMKIDYKALGKRIAKRRRVLNMTQDDVAEATGLSNNHISNIENCHSIPSIDTLVKICEAIDVTPDYLLLGIAAHADAEDDLRHQISQRFKMCDQKKLKLVERFISWIIDEEF